jgi:hypothetical protein
MWHPLKYADDMQVANEQNTQANIVLDCLWQHRFVHMFYWWLTVIQYQQAAVLPEDAELTICLLASLHRCSSCIKLMPNAAWQGCSNKLEAAALSAMSASAVWYHQAGNALWIHEKKAMQSIQLPQMVADLRAEQRLQEESQDRCRLLLHYSHVCFQRICSLQRPLLGIPAFKYHASCMLLHWQIMLHAWAQAPVNSLHMK